MDFLFSTELSIPLFQIGLLLLLGTGSLLFGKVKLALLVNYLFTLYWGFALNWEFLFGKGFESANVYTIMYFGFGLVMVALALIGFLAPSSSD